MDTKFIVARIGLIVTFNMIDYTLVNDIAGGRIINVITTFALSGKIVLMLIAMFYCIVFNLWILPPSFKKRPLLMLFSFVACALSVPLILNFIFLWPKAYGLSFLLTSGIFFLMLYINWKILRRFSP